MNQSVWEDGNYIIDDGWPEAFSVDRIVRLQTNDIHESEAIEGQLRADIHAGLVACTEIVREYFTRSAVWTEDVPEKVIGIFPDCISAPAVRQWMKDNAITPSVHIAAWFEAMGVECKPNKEEISSVPDLHQRRYQMCIAAGLKMPKDDYGKLPNGINKLAEEEGVTVVAFSKSVKKYLAQFRPSHHT